MHPRTKKMFDKLNINSKNLFVVPPLAYLEFNYLVRNSIAVITDSGGITEETTFMKIPCITLRDSTERPETVFIGTNELIGTDLNQICPTIKKLLSKNWKKGRIPKYWDGRTSKRIVEILLKLK